jgi:hypothetical protein
MRSGLFRSSTKSSYSFFLILLTLALYDSVTCVQELGDAMARHCTSARGDCFVLFAGLHQFFVRSGDMVSYYNFDNFDSHPFHATSTPASRPPAI